MSKRTIIIAEAGVNHNGDIEMAKELIDVATEAGADYVKFQTFQAKKLVSKNARLASYQKSGTSSDSQLELLSKLELSVKDHETIIDYCQQKGIRFLSTAFDLESLDFLAKLNLDFFKIPSGEITNLPYLEKVASYGKPIVISTGMANMQDIQAALRVFSDNQTPLDQITVLHCNTQYPTPMTDVNIRAMLAIKNKFAVNVGYSDHTLGIEIPIAAVALGASLIEKHFTLDRNLDGPDHAASIEGKELKEMIAAIRNVELSLKGSGVKAMTASEAANKNIVRKSIHLSGAKKKGDFIKRSDLIMLRPGDGISPMEMYSIIGCRVAEDLPSGTKLLPKHINNTCEK